MRETWQRYRAWRRQDRKLTRAEQWRTALAMGVTYAILGTVINYFVMHDDFWLPGTIFQLVFFNLTVKVLTAQRQVHRFGAGSSTYF